MIDAVGESFDMSVEHGASAATAHAVPGAMDIGPLGGSFFSAADLIPHDRIENFRAAAVIEPKPCSRKSSSVSRIDIRKIRCARWRTSIAVNALMCKPGSSARKLRRRSRYQSFLSVG